MSESGKRDLTVSQVDRQNILNNPYAVKEIEKAAQIKGLPFEGKTVVLKEQIADFFEVTPQTIDHYIEKFSDELRQNGYEVVRGKRLKELKMSILFMFGNETDFVTKTTVLGIFDFLECHPQGSALINRTGTNDDTGDKTWVCLRSGAACEYKQSGTCGSRGGASGHAFPGGAWERGRDDLTISEMTLRMA